MNKKLIACIFSITFLMSIFFAKTINQNGTSDLVLASVEALASGESSSNYGPGKTYDCPGLGTGDGKMCMCENSYACTQIPC